MKLAGAAAFGDRMELMLKTGFGNTRIRLRESWDRIARVTMKRSRDDLKGLVDELWIAMVRCLFGGIAQHWRRRRLLSAWFKLKAIYVDAVLSAQYEELVVSTEAEKRDLQTLSSTLYEKLQVTLTQLEEEVLFQSAQIQMSAAMCLGVILSRRRRTFVSNRFAVWKTCLLRTYHDTAQRWSTIARASATE